MNENTQAKKSGIDKFLGGIETVCNKLPPPAILFAMLFALVAVVGAIVSMAGVSLVNPASGEVIMSRNFFSVDGLHWFLDNMVKNFSSFAPLGLVITMTLGVGFCDESGLIISLLKSSLKNVPPVIVPYLIAFLGTLGNIASDTAAVVIPPLAAIIYLSVGKHPVAGLICGYAGAQAGFAANIIIAGTDSLMQGLTNEAIQGFIPGTSFAVDVTCNWYFMIASTFLCTIVIGTVCSKIVDPRFGKYEGNGTEEKLEEITPLEKKGLRAAGIVSLFYIILVVVGFMAGPLAGENGAFVGSPLLKGLVPILFVLFSLAGLSYGFTAKTFKNAADVNKAMTKQMAGMATFISFCFFCGQFQALFSWTKLGTMMAIGGADLLENAGFTGIPLCVSFVLLIAFINMFITSGSAKWAIFAPIFVPMMMILGYHPALAQLLARLGDSPGNCFTPMSLYIWMVLSVAQTKYMKDCKLGTLVSNLLPIAIVLQISWIIFLVIWMALGIPLGPNAPIHLPAGIIG